MPEPRVQEAKSLPPWARLHKTRPLCLLHGSISCMCVCQRQTMKGFLLAKIAATKDRHAHTQVRAHTRTDYPLCFYLRRSPPYPRTRSAVLTDTVIYNLAAFACALSAETTCASDKASSQRYERTCKGNIPGKAREFWMRFKMLALGVTAC